MPEEETPPSDECACGCSKKVPSSHLARAAEALKALKEEDDKQ